MKWQTSFNLPELMVVARGRCALPRTVAQGARDVRVAGLQDAARQHLTICALEHAATDYETQCSANYGETRDAGHGWRTGAGANVPLAYEQSLDALHARTRELVREFALSALKEPHLVLDIWPKKAL